MIESCGALLVLVSLATGETSITHVPSTSAALESDESGSAYRERASAAVRDVLAKREFADLHSDPNAGWRWVLAWIERFFSGVSKFVSGLPEWLFWTFIAWLVLALMAMLIHLIYTLVKLLRGTSLSGAGKDVRRKMTGELLGIQDLDFDKVHAEARRLLTAGEWTAATRYFYVAAILWLDRQGAIVFKRSKTNADYIAELTRGSRSPGSPRPGTPGRGAGGEGPTISRCPPPSSPALLPRSTGGERSRCLQPFQRLTELFEPIVYGGRQPTNSHMDDISSTVESLLHEPAVDSTR